MSKKKDPKESPWVPCFGEYPPVPPQASAIEENRASTVILRCSEYGWISYLLPDDEGDN